MAEEININSIVLYQFINRTIEEKYKKICCQSSNSHEGVATAHNAGFLNIVRRLDWPIFANSRNGHGHYTVFLIGNSFLAYAI